MTLKEIFEKLKKNDDQKVTLKVSYVEIYNE